MVSTQIPTKHYLKNRSLFSNFLVLFCCIIACGNGVQIPSVSAGECSYATLTAWYSTDALTWENATVSMTQLQKGEPFYIKATITTKTELLAVSLRLWETGEQNSTTSCFELLEGPDCFFHFYPIYHVSPNTRLVYQWKLRVKPQCAWGGSAPLNIQANYNKNDSDSNEIFFTIANIYIQDEVWEENDANIKRTDTNSASSETMVGVVVCVFLLVISILFVWKVFFTTSR